MLRSPLVALSQRRVWTACVLLGLAATLSLGGVLALGGWQLERAQQSAATQYWPAIYVEGQPESAQLDVLIAEVEGWSRVDQVHRRSPEESLDLLRERLGEEEVRRMGLDASLLPVVLEVEPSMLGQGSEALAARVAALEVREEVVAVDLPESQALEALAAWRAIRAGVWLSWALALMGALMGLGGLVWRLREEERAEQTMLEQFGASRVALGRPTLIRGLVLGGAAGVLAAPATLMLFSGFRAALQPLLVDATLSAAAAVPVMLAQVVGGALLGTLIGWVLRRPRQSDTAPGALRPLLDWRLP
ncbi:hypothetical protein DV096_12545 [Bradymonadaceae bacterium TMQ3]|uniref:Cell division protein FtsX n=1 Tax=Lujinxingia sediminis TaxID=2480984 RepID=A0ABY0CRD3_9DELT|nr:hypothetical protein [Lujinxingia sediminis]RDV37929.1 hypothetical protein DV096_12545 [Bradymonadaceae bacterium TMQ3]RVU42743.1 hypothetical protein EA187_14610 [Lujinxingia sediminis]TXC75293.1 hypothetical protein FRC91_11240 [Bradymonadales bacterium TMQ1]